MHVYISIDMEGVAGIATPDQIIRGAHGYPRAQQLMTSEANAAIAGAFDAGAESVLVNDSHGTMDNLLQDQLDPRARLLIGSPKLQCMAEGLTAEHDIALYIGYHAPAGSPGVLAHTFSGYFGEVRLNGTPVSEAEVCALQAGFLGVPVGMVSGDDVICGIASRVFPEVTVVQTKKAHGFLATNTLSPSVACAAIRAGAERAVRRADRVQPTSVPDRLHLAIDMPNIVSAELAESIPGVRRTFVRTIERNLDTPDEVVGLIVVSYQLANIGLRSMLGPLNRV
ncbi:MAG: M55 family metallopeptidase [Nakamurella sp.]